MVRKLKQGETRLKQRVHPPENLGLQVVVLRKKTPRVIELGIEVSKLSAEVLERIASGIEGEISGKLRRSLPRRAEGYVLLVTVEVRDGVLSVEVDLSAGGSYQARPSYEEVVGCIIKDVENIVRKVLMQSGVVKGR